MENRRFDSLVKELFDYSVKRNPDFGSFLGLHKYDDKLPKETRESYIKDVRVMKRYLMRFRRINRARLSDERKLDLELMIHNLRLSIFFSELRMWESNPDIMDRLGSCLFLLVARDFAPVEKRMSSLIKRLEKIPLTIEDTKKRIRKPYKLWTEIAMESCDNFIIFLKSLNSIRLKLHLKERLEKNIDIVIKKVEDYKKFLKKILPNSTDRYSIGKKNFERLIRFRELGLTTDDILDLGNRYLRRYKKQLKYIASKINPALSVKDVSKKIEARHPKTFKEILSAYKSSVLDAKKFLVAEKLMKIPSNEKIVITETPEFLRHTTPFAAYFPPAKFDKKQIGIYIVTPPFNEKILSHYNYAAISNTSVHEAYPGHHLQCSSANMNPSLVRTLTDATELVEGWAHYCEEYMKEIGYEDTNEARFIQTKDMIWRSARIVIDIKLHRNEFSFAKAVDFLVKETGMDRKHAVAEVKRYTMSPSYPLSYMLGKHLINKLKKEIKRKMGKRYTDQFFHNTILQAGSIPIKYMRKEFEIRLKGL